MKYRIVNLQTGLAVGVLFETMVAAITHVEALLQDDKNKDAKFEIVAKVAELKRAPHPVQIKLSQVFYDA